MGRIGKRYEAILAHDLNQQRSPPLSMLELDESFHNRSRLWRFFQINMIRDRRV